MRRRKIMFALGLVYGLWLGAIVGYIIAILMVNAKEADRRVTR
jgi:phage shock protein PspC (stress-responsive transcriptional regulator)